MKSEISKLLTKRTVIILIKKCQRNYYEKKAAEITKYSTKFRKTNVKNKKKKKSIKNLLDSFSKSGFNNENNIVEDKHKKINPYSKES